jgi:hypothetical protein
MLPNGALKNPADIRCEKSLGLKISRLELTPKMGRTILD